MTEQTFKRGAQGGYYFEYDGIKYLSHFPIEWAKDHKTSVFGCPSGPKHCSNCRNFGSIRSVFVFYCANCVNYIYNGEDFPKRNEHIYCSLDVSQEELWENAPYTKGIPISNIGDEVPKPECPKSAFEQLEEKIGFIAACDSMLLMPQNQDYDFDNFLAAERRREWEAWLEEDDEEEEEEEDDDDDRPSTPNPFN